ncbi:hypothetical protein GmHk_09G027332 [Glycine max]|nr:hypothetical protein GmHk_09G027332 [Glycine max]
MSMLCTPSSNESRVTHKSHNTLVLRLRSYHVPLLVLVKERTICREGEECMNNFESTPNVPSKLRSNGEQGFSELQVKHLAIMVAVVDKFFITFMREMINKFSLRTNLSITRVKRHMPIP